MIGETGRMLTTRIRENKYALQTNNMYNSITRHASETATYLSGLKEKVIGFEEHSVKTKI